MVSFQLASSINSVIDVSLLSSVFYISVQGACMRGELSRKILLKHSALYHCLNFRILNVISSSLKFCYSLSQSHFQDLLHKLRQKTFVY